MLRKCIITASLVIAGLVSAPRAASADWLFTPFLGTTFGTGVDFEDTFDEIEFERRFTYGASLGYMGAGIVGFEVDFGYAPNFFETFSVENEGDFQFADDSNVTTFMANVLIGIPIGGQTGPGIRPFAVGGVGLIRTHVGGVEDFVEDLSANDFGFNLGAGINGFFTDNFGIRGDIRYFRAFVDEGGDDDIDLGLGRFDFWRATVGVTFRFGGS